MVDFDFGSFGLFFDLRIVPVWTTDFLIFEVMISLRGLVVSVNLNCRV